MFAAEAHGVTHTRHPRCAELERKCRQLWIKAHPTATERAIKVQPTPHNGITSRDACQGKRVVALFKRQEFAFGVDPLDHKDTTMKPSSFLFASLLTLGLFSGAHAQDGQTMNSGPKMGGTASSGTGVKTGQGPLSQPVPPAASSIYNSQQNLQGNPQRPQGARGPVQTYPSQQPFGTR